MKNQDILNALVQNYGYKKTTESKLPSIDFVYPNYTADGSSESFRFSNELRRELRSRESVVRESLKYKNLVWTTNEEVLLSVGKIAPRLGLEDQITGKINSIYSYSPILFTGFGEKEIIPYVVKPIIDRSMAWFELTSQESSDVRKYLERKATEKPYKNIFQRMFGGSK